MGRTVYAEDGLFNYLTSLATSDTYTVGLILGQSTEDKDYVIHLARTPPPASKDVIEETLIGSTTSVQHENHVKYIKSINDVPNYWVADHAKHVTRMLPGGMWILGIFMVAPEDSLSNKNSTQKLKSIVTAINKNLELDPYLFGNNPHENLILAFNSNTKRFACKSFYTSNDGLLRNADWNFLPKITKWYQVETHVDFDKTFVIVDNGESLKRQLQNILRTISREIESAMVVIEGEPKSSDDFIELLWNKKKKDRKDSKSDDSNHYSKTLQAAIYIPCNTNTCNTEVKIVNCSASIRLVGQLFSRTFVHQKSTIKQVGNSIRQDIMRSMASRLEMHWDSLIEEENGLPEDNITLHEPPRRVLIPLPQNRITLSDYLFPGEGPQEALISLQELLDAEVHESNVQKDLELQVDPTEFYCKNEVKSEPAEQAKYSENNQMIFVISGFGVALIFIVIAILIHHLY